MITQLRELSCHLPVFEKTRADEMSAMQRVATRARAVVDYLQRECDCCGWISRTASCDVYIHAIAGDGPERNVLVYPGMRLFLQSPRMTRLAIGGSHSFC
jgi:hypothetical protein